MSEEVVKPKHPGGRPTIYNDELVERICQLIASTPRSIQDLIKDNEWMPGLSTIDRWKRENKEFRGRYLRAKRDQVHVHVDATLQIADAIDVGSVDPKAASALVQAEKLRCDVRQWYAGRLMPKMYSETNKVEAKSKVEATINGNDIKTKLTDQLLKAVEAKKTE